MSGQAVLHRATLAPGVATAHCDLVAEAPHYAGDLAGPWSLVEFDDGLRCWCPDRDLAPEQIPAETAGRVVPEMIQ